MDPVITAAIVGGIFGGLVGFFSSSLLLIRYFANQVQLIKRIEELQKEIAINREMIQLLIGALIMADSNNLVKIIREAIKRSGSNREDSDDNIKKEDKI